MRMFLVLTVSVFLSSLAYGEGAVLQLITVTTKDIQGTLRRYERKMVSGNWKEIGSPFKVVIGKNGLAGENLKREGDGKAPYGLFTLGNAFGYSSFPESKLNYAKSLPSHECVDDVKSKYYNQIVDRSLHKDADWNSSELMKRNDDLYKLGIVVNYNTKNTEPGNGSCIFLHIWRNDSTGTAGCTAMEENNILELMKWLDQTKNPLLAQLPEGDYESHKKIWDLP